MPGGVYIVNCDKVPGLPNITFVVAGRKMVLEAKDYIMKVRLSLFFRAYEVTVFMLFWSIRGRTHLLVVLEQR